MLIPSNAFKLLKFLHDKFMKYILCGRSYITAINLTSTPVVRTGVYPHMPITVTANSLQHWLLPSKRRPVSHTVRDGQASLSHRANTVKRVIDFSIFGLGGLPLGQRSPKGEMTYYSPRSTILQNFSPIAQTVYEICATKVFHFLALILTPQSHPRSNLMVPIESPWLLRLSVSGGPTSHLSPFSRYFE